MEYILLVISDRILYGIKIKKINKISINNMSSQYFSVELLTKIFHHQILWVIPSATHVS